MINSQQQTSCEAETVVFAEMPELVGDGEQVTVMPPADPAYVDRLQRICDYRAAAHVEVNPLRAGLMGVNSDLLELALNVGETLRQVMTTRGMSIDDLERHSRKFDLYLRVSKQTAQITQLELRLHKDDADAAVINSNAEAKKTLPCAPTDSLGQVAQ